MFEKAIDTAGLNNIGSAKIWLKFIEMEKKKRNMLIVNLLYFIALETPLQNEKIIEDYSETIQTDFDQIL